MANLEPLVKEAVNLVTAHHWMQTVQHAKRLQKEDAKQDIAVERFKDSFIITLSDSSDDEYSD